MKRDNNSRNNKRNNNNNNRNNEPVDLSNWVPKTKLGLKVKNKEITDMDVILDNGLKVYEKEVVEMLLPELEQELLLYGQSKGKFGGGQRREFRQTQKKTKEGNKPKFSTVALVGNKNGYVGIGFGKAKETVPAREKAFRNAKLNMIKIRRGSGSWESTTTEPHSVPFKVSGKCGSVELTIKPAPKGTGIKAEKEVAKILEKAGIQDAWTKARGKTASRQNLIRATFAALKQLTKVHTLPVHKERIGLTEGRKE